MLSKIKFHLITKTKLFATALITTLLLTNCGNNFSEKIITGKIENNYYENKYFKLKIPNDWSAKNVPDTDFILCLVNYNLSFSNNLIVMAAIKRDLANFDNIDDLEQYYQQNLNHISDNMKEYKITKKWEVSKQPEKTIKCLKVYNSNKNVFQSQYFFEVDEFYIGILLTTKNSQDLPILDNLELK